MPFQGSLSARGLALACAIAWSACASDRGAQDRPDPSFDPSEYPSYGFARPLGIEAGGPGSGSGDLAERLRIAVARELESRGYRYDAQDPEMRVNLFAREVEVAPAEEIPSVRIGEDFFGNPVDLEQSGRGRLKTRLEDVDPEMELASLQIQVVAAGEGRMLWQQSAPEWPDDPSSLDESGLAAFAGTLLAGFPRAGPPLD